jgi:hypothetical protein
MNRLWTYQECVLGYEKGVWVAFSNSVVNIKPYINRALKFPVHEFQTYVSPLPIDAATPFISIQRFASPSMASTLRSFKDFMKSIEDGKANRDNCFSLLAEGLANRETSKPGDEPICIASILKMDVKGLVDLPDDKRMEALYAKVGRASPSLLFMPHPKLQTDGFRWAPSTFLQRLDAVEPGLTLESAVKLDDKLGLPVTYSGYHLTEENNYISPTKRIFFLDQETDIWCMMVRRTPPRLWHEWPYHGDEGDFIPGFLDPPPFEDLRNAVVILRSISFKPGPTGTAALVTVTGSSK